ncbi:PLC-like phosphodiesterase [Schizophyllum commune]
MSSSMELTLVNLSNDGILCGRRTSNANVQVSVALQPSEATSTRIPSHCSEDGITLALLALGEKAQKWTIEHEHLVTRASTIAMPSWRSIDVSEDCPWRVYCRKIRRHHRILYLFPRRSTAGFLSDMHDGCPLSSLLLPGTHDSMAFYGWPVAQCQSIDTPLSVQLESGIRVLDIRLALVKDSLIAYHGITPQRTPFQDILTTMHAFLTAPASCRETLVVSIKQEDFATTPAPKFSAAVHAEMLSGPGGKEMWYLENRIPRLGEVRGKAVLFSRFGGNGDGWDGGLEGLGIHPTTWPDSAKDGFSWNCKDTLVRTHDWYSIPSFLSIPEKVVRATENLLPPDEPAPMPILNVSFFSASSFPLAAPPTIAQGFGWPKYGLGVEGVNSRVGRWLLDKLGQTVQAMERGDDHSDEEFEEKPPKKPVTAEEEMYVVNVNAEPRIRGWAFTDYYARPEASLVALMIECNYRGRKEGEEGW